MSKIPELLYVSIGPAPCCEVCHETMVPASRIEWQCDNEECSQFEIAFHLGIYPANEVKPDR